MNENTQASVGQILREAREAQGVSVDDVAMRLRLMHRQIAAMETDDFGSLGQPVFARGFVRNYARLLNLDPESLVERMAPPGGKAPDPGRIGARHGEEVRSSAASRRSTLLYAGFSVALLALVGAVAYEWRQEKAAPELVAAREPKRSDPTAATKASPALRETPPPAEPKPVEKQEPAEKPAEQAPSEAPEARPAEAEAPASPEPEAAPEPALPPGVHRLVLRMKAEAWLEVRDGAGRNLVSSLNPAGSERAVRGRPPFELVIGNASQVELTYDGEPVDLEPHMRGEVARFTLK